jgi:hypothetical protein
VDGVIVEVRLCVDDRHAVHPFDGEHDVDQEVQGG